MTIILHKETESSMKKLIMMLGVAAMLVTGGAAQGNEFAEKAALYIPNRIVDALDAFSVNLGFGPSIRAELMCTRAAVVGGGYGLSCKVFKDYNRQYGLGTQNYWYWSLAAIGEEDTRRDRFAGWTKSYWEAYAGFPLPDQRIYDMQDGARDYWQIGGALGFLVEGEVYIHPVEGIDWVLGFFFLDPKSDDLTFDDFR